MKVKILIIDDEFIIRLTMKEALSDLGYEVETCENMKDGMELIEAWNPDFVLLDNRLENDMGIDYIEKIKKIAENTQIILMTAYGSVSQAVEAIKKGAYNYIVKPFDIEAINIMIKRCLENLKNKESLKRLMGKPQTLIGRSEAIKNIYRQIQILGQNSNVDVLIRGETGTGKEVVANLIHKNSNRGEQLMIKINCGAIPDNLLESELFGYEKGAFTGAVTSKKGLLELGNDGTVFLDEIGELPMTMQAKLLSFLEDRKFKRVGGLKDIYVNTRVIAATNKNLENAIQDGTFREDLFYRLNVFQIYIPPLKERREDIKDICDYYLKFYNDKFSKNIKYIDENFKSELMKYEWRGNVRELKNVIERSFLYCNGDTLYQYVDLKYNHIYDTRSDDVYVPKDLTLESINLEEEVNKLEKLYIHKALEISGNNYTKAAEILGTTRFTLKRKLDA